MRQLTHSNTIDNTVIGTSIVLIQNMQPTKSGMSNSQVKGCIVDDLVTEGRDAVDERDNLVDERDLGLRDDGRCEKDRLEKMLVPYIMRNYNRTYIKQRRQLINDDPLLLLHLVLTKTITPRAIVLRGKDKPIKGRAEVET